MEYVHAFHMSTYSGLGLCDTTYSCRAEFVSQLRPCDVGRQKDSINYLEDAYGTTTHGCECAFICVDMLLSLIPDTGCRKISYFRGIATN